MAMAQTTRKTAHIDFKGVFINVAGTVYKEPQTRDEPEYVEAEVEQLSIGLVDVTVWLDEIEGLKNEAEEALIYES